jgi:hypothetical protein
MFVVEVLVAERLPTTFTFPMPRFLVFLWYAGKLQATPEVYAAIPVQFVLE